jgi:kynurenine formamidase
VSDALLEVVRQGVRIFDLGRPMFTGMPQSPNHPRFLHTVPRRHGDVMRADGGSAANDLLVTGTHVGTHIDALAHVSHQGRLHGGADAAAAMKGGRFMTHGVHTIAPMVCRGVLLDIPAALGIEACPPGYEITAADLADCAARQATPTGRGDVVLIRSGWGRRFDEGAEAYLGLVSGVPGVGVEGAQWLADRGILAAGADTVAFEQLPPDGGHALLPAHRVLLVEHGVYIVEALNLEELAVAGLREFTFVLAPLNLVGATGSPVRPLAVAAHA